MLNKENAGLQLNVAGDLVTAVTDKAENTYAIFSTVFTNKASAFSERVQGGEELPAADEDQVRNYVPHKSVACSGLHPKVLGELPHVLQDWEQSARI